MAAAGGRVAGPERERAALLALALSMFSLATASLAVLGIGAEVARSFGVAPGAAGLLVTAFALPYAALAPLLQWWSGGRFGPRALVVGGTLLTACGLGLTAAAPGWGWLLLGRGVTAAGGALLAPAALAAATNLAPPEQRGRALATVFGGFTLASVVGVPLATQLGFLLGWRGTLLAVAALALATAMAAHRALPPMPAAERLGRGAWAALLRRPAVLGLLGGGAAQLAAQFVALGVMPALLVDHFGLGAPWLPLAVLAFGLGGVLGNWLGGRWTDRAAPAAPLRASFVGLALVFAALSLPLGGWGGAAALAALAVCGTLFRPPQLVLLTRLASAEERAPVLGLNTAAGYVGLAVGSALGAFVAARLGFGALGWAGLALLAVAWFPLRRAGRG